MPFKVVHLHPKKDESVRRFHPWLFSGAIHHIDGVPQEGEIVEVRDADNRFLALGHCQIGSIAIRILTFKDEPLNQAFWEKRFAAAWQLRQSLNLSRADNNAYRLIHGEGDSLPGLIVDIYGNTAVMQAHSPGMHLLRETLAQALKSVTGNAIENVYYKSDTTLPYKAELDAENGYLIGNGEHASCKIFENGLQFRVDWEKGQKTGFFLDQRDNRSLLEKYARNRKILNLFCYTGGFSCYALRGGAEIVHSVDSSSKAIRLANENVALNFPDDARHQSFTEDAFKFLENADDSYDLILLDPPAFAKHRNVLKNALQGYRKLNALAFEKIRRGGILFTFSCSQAVSRENFRLAVFSAAAQTKKNVKILHQLAQPADHPINIYHPEGEYLKGLVLAVE